MSPRPQQLNPPKAGGQELQVWAKMFCERPSRSCSLPAAPGRGHQPVPAGSQRAAGSPSANSSAQTMSPIYNCLRSSNGGLSYRNCLRTSSGMLSSPAGLKLHRTQLLLQLRATRTRPGSATRAQHGNDALQLTMRLILSLPFIQVTCIKYLSFSGEELWFF